MPTKIEWTKPPGYTGDVWNPTTGCSKVSAGCKHCYAEVIANRFWGERKFTDLLCHPDRLDKPLKRKKPTCYFVNSMSDLFHEDVPFEFIDKVFSVMAMAPQHTFQVLTKRPERMIDYFKGNKWGLFSINGKPLNNVWLGVSVENQETADERIPLLLQTPAAVRFISAEPLLGPIKLNAIRTGTGSMDGLDCALFSSVLDGERTTSMCSSTSWEKLDWVIVGGESGPKARPMHPDWVRSLRDQCQAAQVPFFFKQWGQWAPTKAKPIQSDWLDGKAIAMDGQYFYKAGKKKAGRILDGKTYSEYPT